MPISNEVAKGQRLPSTPTVSARERPVVDAAADAFRVVIPAARRREVERCRDHGMLRGLVILDETEGVTFDVRCTDERDALWLRLCYS
jgi:hypothetical protein